MKTPSNIARHAHDQRTIERGPPMPRTRDEMAALAAEELRDGHVVNLGMESLPWSRTTLRTT